MSKGFWVWVPSTPNGGGGGLVFLVIIIALICGLFSSSYRYEGQIRSTMSGNTSYYCTIDYTKSVFSDSIFGSIFYERTVHKDYDGGNVYYKLDTPIRGVISDDKLIIKLDNPRVECSNDLTHEEYFPEKTEITIKNDTTITIKGIDCYGG